MALGDIIDAVIEPFAPRSALRRRQERIALKEVRQYDAGAHSRRTSGWKRVASSADRETQQGLVGLRNGARELVRNNKYASSALRQMVANAIGDGIAARAIHPDKEVAAAAQDAWDRWAESKVDGRNDFYGVQKLAFRSMAEGGESLIIWGPDKDGPDGRCRVIEGDFLDHTLNNDRTGAGRIVQGVEFDENGDRVGYWLYDRHPGDLSGYSRSATRFAAQHVDHLFEELRPGQTRGVSWFAPVAMDLRDIADYEDAVLMKRKVEACLALVLTPGEGNAGSPLATQTAQTDGKPAIETVRPGMIFRTKPGETATTLNPSSGGDGNEHVKQQIAAIVASLAPYHLVTGDPNRANYSGLRAISIGFWANLDDWQQNLMLPQQGNPAFRRRMRRLQLETGDRRFLQVKSDWAVPRRHLLDPLKDIAGEVAEIRAGLKLYSKALSERGVNWEDHFAEMDKVNKQIDLLNLALEVDPRTVTNSGVLQAGAGLAASNSASGQD